MNNTEKWSPKNRFKKRKRPNQSITRHRVERRQASALEARLPAAGQPYKKVQPLNPVEMAGAFNSLIPELQHALVATGYTVPTAVQAQAISPQLEGKDILGSAQTGTGKTAAFTLPLLQRLSNKTSGAPGRHPRALIVAPTRELAAQIGESIRTYGQFLQVTHTVIYGGVGQVPQKRAMNNGVDIVVATPGRLLDLMSQGFVKLDAIETFVLDEADRMLDMGFLPDIKRIIAELPRRRQTLFFSATLAPEIVTLANRLLVDPVRITINPGQPTVDKICQRVLFVNREDKDKLLISILREPGVGRVLVFAQMKHMANRVCERLQRSGISAAPIHGNRSQSARMAALNGFRNGQVKVLVATDIAARGIDVDCISHVINYDLPAEPQTYVHRIGRTARAGSRGQAWSFCTAQDRALLKDIERLLNKRVPMHTDHEFHSQTAFSVEGVASRTGRGGSRRPTARIPAEDRTIQRPNRNGYGGGRRRRNSRV